MQVELLCLVLVVVVSVVVHQAILQAGPRGGRVAAAERNAVQQVTAVHIAPNAAAGEVRRDSGKRDGID